MPRPRRLLAIAALVLLAGCNDTLRSNLSERQANEIMAMLQQHRITATPERERDGSWRLEVAPDRRELAIELLNAYELPGQTYSDMLQIFPKEGFMSSPVEERARYQYGLAQELEKTLSHMEGVVLARVHVTIPGREFLKDASSQPASASIFVKYRSDMSMAGKEEDIRDLVAHSIGNIPHENVSIMMSPVTPKLGNPAARIRSGWFGVHYREGNWLTVTLLYSLPWLAILAWLAWRAWRWPAWRGWHARLSARRGQVDSTEGYYTRAEKR
ncbi:type III secretion system inner membrane ring lipoprotein SctJ [Herbaspirillum sp. YR522]|uniref:type III secretion system inner membrane ring lipoprotein SctJ n=1 Tax=Herbaspirillum sp. YR522 TaxID=1144342 RepID=UPI00026FC500|nr:type III secretion inner membrane ring lipoprotein SctJ [Herbaspirillum sp. YR522]EJN02571.1 type III secretion apparatus lipoprotein, YscJ/HrcJ family [Herbaspirillum sp. YR522]